MSCRWPSPPPSRSSGCAPGPAAAACRPRRPASTAATASRPPSARAAASSAATTTDRRVLRLPNPDRPDRSSEERRRVAARFDEAVRLAEQAFATEFARLLSHLTSRLANGETGERQVFRDSAVANPSACFGRFTELNVRSNPELDALVRQAQEL